MAGESRWPQSGCQVALEALEYYFNNVKDGEIRLFQNDYTPTRTTVLGDLTECDFSGYAAQSWNGWVASTWDGVNYRAKMVADSVTWTKSGATGNDVYGAYVVDEDGNLIYAQRFASGPIPMSVDGAALVYEPTITDKSEFT